MIQDDIRDKKRKLRKEILAIRDRMPEEMRLQESEKIRGRIRKMESRISAGKLLAFAGFGSEIITDGIIEDALLDGKEVYLPKVEGEQMRFYRIFSMDHLTAGYKGIREPEPEEKLLLRIEDGEKPFLLLPGVAFDDDRRRIGYGKGFYDRFLEISGKRLFVCAVALSCQIVDRGRIPTEDTDYSADCLLHVAPTSGAEVLTANTGSGAGSNDAVIARGNDQ